MAQVIVGDITTLEVDAIVNAANSELMVGGGVDYAIHEAAGPGLKNEIRSQHNYLPAGEAITTSGYLLPAKYVIHTVAPIWKGGSEGELEVLAECYNNSIARALEKNMRSIAFPSLGTGAFGIPIEKAAEVAMKVIAESYEPEDDLEVTFCCYSEEDFEIYTSTIQRLVKEAEASRLLPDCPVCFHRLKWFAYGMMASPPDEDLYIMGGCVIGPDQPDIGCSNCGWEGQEESLNEVWGRAVFAVVDDESKTFVGGMIYEPGFAHSYMELVPHEPDFGRGVSLEALDAIDAKAKSPRYWVAQERELLEGTLEKVHLGYQALTPEVMRFVGFREAEKRPKFLDR